MGRVSVGLIAGLCGLGVAALVMSFSTWTRNPPIADSAFAGLAVALAVFLALDRLGVVPDDTELPTNLDIRSR